MIPKTFSLGKLAMTVLKEYPSLRFRDKDSTTHNASDSTKCIRQITYKALKTKESNPTDNLGHMRMRFGSWLERGVQYDILGKMAPFGVIFMGGQGDTGEHGTFYGTSWHGYRDMDILIKSPEGKLKPVVVELKTKVGYGASCTIKKNAWSKEFIVPEPDQEWGYSQQLGLYLRDAYHKTKEHPNFASPLVDGILLQLLYADGLACFVEYFFEYLPDVDSVRCYRVHCEQYPEVSSPLDIIVPLKPIAERWAEADEFLKKGELAPPTYQRRYDVDDPRVAEATKKDLELAIKSKVLIGDIHCKYCPFRDTCADDLKVPMKYDASEVRKLKLILKNK